MKFNLVIKLSVLMSILLMFYGCRLSEPVKLTESQKANLEDTIYGSMQQDNLKTAVVCIGRGQKIIYNKAFNLNDTGKDTVHPDTIFDLASLTKPVATAASVMLLIDRGKLTLDDPVGKYLPDFACNGKENARIRHLLSHTSGLGAYTNAKTIESEFACPCPDKVIQKICSLKTQSKPGEKMTYSCLGYITLSRIINIVSGQSLDEFSHEHLFKPLDMNDTMFNPPADLLRRIAPADATLHGKVHDPLASLMGGISGNAGLYSTTRDLSKYCMMLLNGGKAGKRRILSRKSVELLTTLQSHGRAYGFDVSSSYAWIKGNLAPEGTFCHSGFTGTSIVCDPESKIFIIILTNRLWPDGSGATRHIRTRTADMAFGYLLKQPEK